MWQANVSHTGHVLIRFSSLQAGCMPFCRADAILSASSCLVRADPLNSLPDGPAPTATKLVSGALCSTRSLKSLPLLHKCFNLQSCVSHFIGHLLDPFGPLQETVLAHSSIKVCRLGAFYAILHCSAVVITDIHIHPDEKRTHIQMLTNCLSSSRSSSLGHVLPHISKIVRCKPFQSPLACSVRSSSRALRRSCVVEPVKTSPDPFLYPQSKRQRTSGRDWSDFTSGLGSLAMALSFT